MQLVVCLPGVMVVSICALFGGRDVIVQPTLRKRALASGARNIVHHMLAIGRNRRIVKRKSAVNPVGSGSLPIIPGILHQISCFVVCSARLKSDSVRVVSAQEEALCLGNGLHTQTFTGKFKSNSSRTDIKCSESFGRGTGLGCAAEWPGFSLCQKGLTQPSQWHLSVSAEFGLNVVSTAGRGSDSGCELHLETSPALHFSVQLPPHRQFSVDGSQ